MFFHVFDSPWRVQCDLLSFPPLSLPKSHRQSPSASERVFRNQNLSSWDTTECAAWHESPRSDASKASRNFKEAHRQRSISCWVRGVLLRFRRFLCRRVPSGGGRASSFRRFFRDLSDDREDVDGVLEENGNERDDPIWTYIISISIYILCASCCDDVCGMRDIERFFLTHRIEYSGI